MTKVRGEIRSRFPSDMRRAALVVLAVAAAPMTPAWAGEGGPAGPSTAVSFEAIEGTDLKRVILTARAAERIGIQLGEVFETKIVRTQVVGGRVVPPIEGTPDRQVSAGGSFANIALAATGPTAQPSPANVESMALETAWALVTVTPDEWARTKKDRPVRITRLETRKGSELLAMPSSRPPAEDPKRTMLTVYYEIMNGDHDLQLHERVRVELPLEDTDQTRTVVPYSAVYYDGHGKPWVYVNSATLTYERQPIEIERIEGNLAVLTASPPLGTKVVTVGAPLLYGAEVIYKR